MDILAHTLWTNAAARGANALAEKGGEDGGSARGHERGRKFHIHPGWAAFWGVFPDFFAFTIPFLVVFWKFLTGQGSFHLWAGHHGLVAGFDVGAYLYQYSHSLVIWALVFLFVWAINRRPRWELLGWALHILIDIPSHGIGYYATPFLFPISEYRFPYGISWATPWYMIINYSTLAVVWVGILIKKYKKRFFR